MADRDLLNKPMPLVIPEDRDHNKRSIPAPTLGKLGVQVRAPLIGVEPDAPALKTPAPQEGSPGHVQGRGRPAAVPPRGRKGATEPGLRPKEAPEPEAAYKAAYFNRDVGHMAGPNLRARPMAALRGEEGATDLKRVVLPPPAGSDAPSPEQLGGALARMLPGADAGQASGAPSLQGLVAQMSALTQEAGMTPEKLLQRMAQLEAMVAARKQALMRLVGLTPGHIQRSRTLAQAVMADGHDPAQSATLVEDADALIGDGHHDASLLHKRLKKVMGVKG